MEQGKGLDP